MSAPNEGSDFERYIAEGVFQRANLMSIARGDGEIVAGIVTDALAVTVRIPVSYGP